jgi:hypothetical protein
LNKNEKQEMTFLFLDFQIKNVPAKLETNLKEFIMYEFIEWERRVLQELYDDYQDILRQRRLNLRPAAISLTDSESFWAQWNPVTRTILISRKLVREHNWFQVQSILRHEMAHQFIDESQAPSSDQEAPHGEVSLCLPKAWSSRGIF